METPTQQTGSYKAAPRTAPAVAAGSEDTAQTVPYRADAPVVGGSAAVPAAQARPAAISADDGKTHVVAPGENLFRISLAHGLKYQQVASWNNLPDYNIKVGQVLRLTPPGQDGAAAGNVKTYPKAVKLPYSAAAQQSIAAQSEGHAKQAPMQVGKADSSSTTPKVASSAATAVTTPSQRQDASSAQADGADSVTWAWPTNGKVLRGYSDSNKGVDIGGRMGQPVLAAGDGKVVYSGNGLRGYGKLIIIKHNKTYLSAYAHNSQLLVKEGQTVKRGQKIAEMGNSDADQVKLHFEIRRFGKPVDPMQYLKQ